MSEQEQAKKLQEVFADKSFAEKLLGLDTAEEVQAALKDNGVELSTQEIVGIRDVLVKQLESGEEIAPEQLKNVAGGFAITTICSIIFAAIGGAAGAASQTHKWTRGRW